jgi:hypothetical protein
MYKVPIYETNVVAAQGNQSLKTVTGEVTGFEVKYATPFTVATVLEQFKDSLPQNNLRYVTLNSTTHMGKQAVTIEKRYFLAWLLAPIEFLIEYNKTGNKALVQIDIKNIPEEYKSKINDDQLKEVNQIITNSNINLLEQLEAKRLEDEKKIMAGQGITNETPTNVAKVTPKSKEKPVIVSERESY